MVIFNSYVSLPEGILKQYSNCTKDKVEKRTCLYTVNRVNMAQHQAGGMFCFTAPKKAWKRGNMGVSTRNESRFEASKPKSCQKHPISCAENAVALWKTKRGQLKNMIPAYMAVSETGIYHIPQVAILVWNMIMNQWIQGTLLPDHIRIEHIYPLVMTNIAMV